MRRDLAFSKPVDIEKRATGYPRSVSQEYPVIQRQNPTSQFSVRLLHKPLIERTRDTLQVAYCWLAVARRTCAANRQLRAETQQLRAACQILRQSRQSLVRSLTTERIACTSDVGS